MADSRNGALPWRTDINFGGDLGVLGSVVKKNGLFDGMPLAADPGDVFTFYDDFYSFDNTATVGDWTSFSTGTSGHVLQDTAGGSLAISTQPSTPADNDEAYDSSIQEIFTFAATKKLWFEARVHLTEANTDDANIIVGLSDKVGTGTLTAAGGGPQADYDGAVFFKVDGGTVWQFESSNATTQVTDSSVATFTSASIYKLGFYFDATATTSRIIYYIDGVQKGTQAITLSGLLPMHVLLGIRNGGANIETLIVDYVKVAQLR